MWTSQHPIASLPKSGLQTSSPHPDDYLTATGTGSSFDASRDAIHSTPQKADRAAYEHREANIRSIITPSYDDDASDPDGHAAATVAGSPLHAPADLIHSAPGTAGASLHQRIEDAVKGKLLSRKAYVSRSTPTGPVTHPYHSHALRDFVHHSSIQDKAAAARLLKDNITAYATALGPSDEDRADGITTSIRPHHWVTVDTAASSEHSSQSDSIEVMRGKQDPTTTTMQDDTFNAERGSLYHNTQSTPIMAKNMPHKSGGGIRKPSSDRKSSKQLAATTVPQSKLRRDISYLQHDLRAALKEYVNEDVNSYVQDYTEETVQHTATFNTRNTRFTRSRNVPSKETSALPQLFTTAEAAARHTAQQNATAQSTNSFIIPDIPNIHDLVSGGRNDATPVLNRDRNLSSRSRFSSRRQQSAAQQSQPQPPHEPVESVPLPQEEKAIYASLQTLKRRVDSLEIERLEFLSREEYHEEELISLRNQLEASQTRPDSGLGYSEEEAHNWQQEKQDYETALKTMQDLHERSKAKSRVVETGIKKMAGERDRLIEQLGAAYSDFNHLKIEHEDFKDVFQELREEHVGLYEDHERLKAEHEELKEEHEEFQMYIDQWKRKNEETTTRNNGLQLEVDGLQQEIEDLRMMLEETQSSHSDETVQRETAQSQLANMTLQHQQLQAALQQQQHQAPVQVQQPASASEVKDSIGTVLVHDIHGETQQTEETQGCEPQEGGDQPSIEMSGITGLTALTKDQSINYSKLSLEEVLRDNTAERIQEAFMNSQNAKRQHKASEGQSQRSMSQTKQSQRAKSSQRFPSTRWSQDSGFQMCSVVENIRKAKQQQETSDSGLRSTSRSRHSQRAKSSQRYPSISRWSQDPDCIFSTDVEMSHAGIPGNLSVPKRRFSKRSTFPTTAVVNDFPAPPSAVETAQTPAAETVQTPAAKTVHTQAAETAEVPKKDSTDDTILNFLNRDNGNFKLLRNDLEAVYKSHRRPVSDSANPTATTSVPAVAPPLKSIMKDFNDINTKLIKSVRVRSPHSKNDDRTPVVPSGQKTVLAPLSTVTPPGSRITGHPRRKIEEEADTLTSAFIIPDITLENVDIDATIRPAEAPSVALAKVMEQLGDEILELKGKLAAYQKAYGNHDPSISKRRRLGLKGKMEFYTGEVERRSEQMYRLHDVMTGV